MITSIESRLAELIAIPSVNPALGGAGESALAHWVAEHLSAMGAEVWMQPVVGERCNVWAALRPHPGPAIVLEAHLDTVAPGAGWQHDPFSPVVRDGRMYGLGACDTKGSLATFLSVFAEFAQAPHRLAQPLILAATIDEEVAQQGAYALMDGGVEMLGVVTGEPTRNRIVHAHKGFVRFALHTAGRAAHSSTPERGESAIRRMVSVLTRLDAYAAALERREPHTALGRPTVNVGTVAGGTGVNVVPDHCVARVDRRTLPGETAASVQREIAEHLGEAEWLRWADVVERPALFTPVEARLVTSLRQALQDTGQAGELEAAPYLTNAVAYAAAGVPALVFGPGDLAQAHTPDEFITLAELHAAHRALSRWLERGIDGTAGATAP
jgi:acetylornithine deacetylase/succinyl-diaminopimelate desuccinylase family protein